MTPTEKLADRLTKLLEAKGVDLRMPVDPNSIFYLRGGARKEALDWGCQRWTAYYEITGLRIKGTVHSGDSLTNCARRAHLEIRPSGNSRTPHEWEAYSWTKKEQRAELILRAERPETP